MVSESKSECVSVYHLDGNVCARRWMSQVYVYSDVRDHDDVGDVWEAQISY